MPLLAPSSSTTRPGFATRQPSSKNSFRHSPGRQQVVVGGAKGGIFQAEDIAKTRQRQRSQVNQKYHK
jgi:hypothetical protein